MAKIDARTAQVQAQAHVNMSKTVSVYYLKCVCMCMCDKSLYCIMYGLKILISVLHI